NRDAVSLANLAVWRLEQSADVIVGLGYLFWAERRWSGCSCLEPSHVGMKSCQVGRVLDVGLGQFVHGLTMLLDLRIIGRQILRKIALLVGNQIAPVLGFLKFELSFRTIVFLGVATAGQSLALSCRRGNFRRRWDICDRAPGFVVTSSGRLAVTGRYSSSCISRLGSSSCVAAMASFLGPACTRWFLNITGVSYLCLLRVRALMDNRLPIGGLHGLYKVLHRDRLSFRIAMVYTACISGGFVVHLCRRTFVDVRD